MTPLDHLKQLILEDQSKRYPNVPEHCRTINTFVTMKPEKREKKRIELFLNLTGNYGAIIENRGQRKDDRKEVTDVIGQRRLIGSIDWIGSGMRKGIADIKAIIKGKPYDIELKRVYGKGKDRQSDKQKEEQQRIERAGGNYLIVSDFEDFYYKYLNL